MENNMKFTDQSQIQSDYFQNLDNISGVKELSNEVATSYNGGQDAVTLFDDGFFNPNKGKLGVNTDFNDLGVFNFNNKTSSIDINRGTWTLYPQKDFKDGPGPSKAITLSPGKYNVNDLQQRGLKDNTLSSIFIQRTL